MAESPARTTAVLTDDPDGVATAAAILHAGGLVGIPTETVYGLAADAEDPEAVLRIFTAKGRPADQPLIVHVRPDWAPRYSAPWPPAAEALAAAFWPGPLTLVVPRSDLVPTVVTGGLDSVGLRSPSHPVAIDLLDAFDRGIAAPSANRYGHVSPTTARHVLDDLAGRIDAVIDAGPSDVGLESTIIEVDVDGGISLLRRGAITLEQIVAVVGAVTDRTTGPVRAPGMVHSHYAPAAPVEVLAHTDLRDRLASLDHSTLIITSVPVDHSRVVHLEGDAGFASGLYEALRLGDAPEVTEVLVVPPTEGPMVAAILDRLRRASHR